MLAVLQLDALPAERQPRSAVMTAVMTSGFQVRPSSWAARSRSDVLIATGRLSFRQAAVETFTLEPGEDPFDVAFAVRVGVLDGRLPRDFPAALDRLRAAVRPGGRLFVDGGDPLREIPLRGRG